MKTFTADGERVLSVHTVAGRFGVSDRTVRFWAGSGRLPGFKDGPKIWRFRESEVAAAQVRLTTWRRNGEPEGNGDDW
jgi:excisionase family DNA binding protein